MKHLRLSVLLIVFLILALALPATAQDGADQVIPESPAPSADGVGADETSLLWFVQFASSPTADGGDLGTIQNEHANFHANAQAAGLQYSTRFDFTTLWNGVSIQLNDTNEIGKLGKITGVQRLYPVLSVAIPEVSINPDLLTALNQTGASIVQDDLGFTGAGVRVAVMDTGIDLDHPDLGGDGDPTNAVSFNSRVVTGWDFVGDNFDASASIPTPAVPDPYPDDCNGHGTHVAGIIGASAADANGVTGVAPGVTFGAYRVFGCAGSTTADIMIAAMERALADDMDVLNMSIGSAFQWPDYPTAEASDRLVNQGVVVVASIGNNGANGAFSAGAPGLGAKVIGVAAFDNTHINSNLFRITPDDRPVQYIRASAAPVAPTEGTFQMARTGTQTSTADACTALPAGSLAGKVVLIRRGTCGFYNKAFNAQQAGAAAVVLYNNVAGVLTPTVAPNPPSAPPVTIPVVMVTMVEGNLIDSRLAAGDVWMTWTPEVGTMLHPTPGTISSFSSYGLSPDLALKPDIGAPGGQIWSTYPLEIGGYANISGTSMSSPHVAGAVALLLEAHPDLSSQSVDEVLQNSADPQRWWGSANPAFRDNVHRQGAGMLDIYGAIVATARITPSELALGESEAGPATRTLTVSNTGGVDVTFTLGHTPALATGGSTFAPSFFNAPATVTFTSAGVPVGSVTVMAGGSAAVDVTITANPTLSDRSQYGGYLVFTGSDGSTYRVPFAGFKGDYQTIVAVPTRAVPAVPLAGSNAALPAGGTLPTIARLTACTVVFEGDCTGTSTYQAVSGGTFNLTDAFNRPYFLLHFDHQVRQLRATVFSTAGKNWHLLGNFTYLGRNSTSTSFFAFPWDGTTTSGTRSYTVPDGQYVVVFQALKANGDPANPAHWETWTSPVVTIDRP